MKSAGSSLKGGKNALIFIALTMAIDMAGVGIIVPVMPDLIAQLKGVSIGDAAGIGGWMVFAYAGMQFFCAPIAGNLGDRFGRRPVLLVALIGLAVDYLIMAAAGALWMLFLGRVAAGIAGSTWAVANAIVADLSTGEERAKNFGIVSAAGAAGLILGPAIGGALGAIDVRAPFYAAAVLTAANALYGWLVLPETVTTENRRAFEWSRANPVAGLAQIRRHAHVVGILAALFTMHIANQSLVHLWSYYVKERFEWDTIATGVSITFYGISVAAVQGGLTGPAVRRFGEERAATIGLIFGIAAYLLLAFAPYGWMMYLSIIVGAFGGFITPSMQSLMTKSAPANAQGELQGAISSTLAITLVIGPLIMTQLFSYFTEPGHLYFPGAPFFVSALLCVASGVMFKIALARKPKAPVTDEPAEGEA